MKTYYSYCFQLCVLLPFISLSQHFNPKSAIPKSLSKYSFGMAIGEFTTKNKSAIIRDSQNTFRIEYFDNEAGGDIKDVTYYFDAENNQPLYEMIIRFNDEQALNNHCSKKLGEQNDKKGWTWNTKEGYVFKAWRFSNTLVLALGLPFTEWEKEWDY